MSGEALTCPGVTCPGQVGRGSLKLNATHIGWQGTAVHGKANQLSLPSSSLVAAEWHRSCGQGRCLLRLVIKDDPKGLCFAGVKPDDMVKVKSHFQSVFKVGIEEQTLATEGWNWGDVNLERNSANQDLRFEVNGKLGFDLPVGHLKQVSTIGKADINVEFQADPGAGTNDDVLAEIRFYVPGSGPGFVTAESLREKLHMRGGVSAGEALVRFSDIMIQAPRGKHDFEIFERYMKIHGKTQSYTVPFSTVDKLHLLPYDYREDDESKVSLVLRLTEPLRQGTQQHYYLELQFDSTDRVSDETREAAAKRIKKDASETFKCLGWTLQTLTGIKTTTAPALVFKEKNPQKEYCIRCSYRAAHGKLFFNKHSMMYLHKPVLWVRYDEVESVKIEAGKMRGRSFDMAFTVKLGDKVVKHEFASMDKAVLRCVLDFLKNTGVQIEDLETVEMDAQLAVGLAAQTKKDDSRKTRLAARRSRQLNQDYKNTNQVLVHEGSDTDKDDEDFEEEKGGDDSDSSDFDEDVGDADAPPAQKRPRRKG